MTQALSESTLILHKAGFAVPGGVWRHFILPWARLYRVYSGNAELRVDGEPLALAPGLCALIPPQCEVVARRDEVPRHLAFHFEWHHAGRSVFETNTFPASAPDGSPLGEGGAAAWPLREFGPNRAWLAEAHLRILLSPFVDGSRALRRPVVSGLGRALSYLEAHLGEDISIPLLAEQAGLSPKHFSALFSKAMGRSPKLYLTERRFLRVKRQLCLSDEPIHAVAVACGFQDPVHFGKLFRKYAGLSPGAYRQRARQGLQP